MKFRVTSLTPLLVGDGQKLSPIDYMVWKDHVNVLDQKRIFKLLSKGPRLDSYLTQIKKADRLDFASWGGFAQNYAGRRIPFEHPSAGAFLERARIESMHIPTFSSGPSGPFLPATAIKGALRTAMVFRRAEEKTLRDLAAKAQDRDRPLRRPGETLEQSTVGTSGNSRTRVIEAGDSQPISPQALKIYLLRVATLQQRGGDRLELGWKQGSATVDSKRVDESTPWFAEMAQAGTVFEGKWSEPAFFQDPDVVRAIHWGRPTGRSSIFEAANEYAMRLLELHRKYSEQAGLTELTRTLERQANRVEATRGSDASCVLCLGWGAGFVSKTAFPDTATESYRQLLQQVPLYSKALRSGMPFPKTRRIVFESNRPSSLPGWVLLEVE
jgi:CRISPR-associated protein Csm5